MIGGNTDVAQGNRSKVLLPLAGKEPICDPHAESVVGGYDRFLKEVVSVSTLVIGDNGGRFKVPGSLHSSMITCL
jgi:hypothetical protein